MVAIHKLICSQQRAWASQQGISFDEDGYTLSLIDNLYLLPSPEIIEEFRSSKGEELGSEGSRGKMQALHSSSALVLNVFQYWRKIGRVDVVAKACGIQGVMNDMRFERTHPTPLGGVPPHLDIELSGDESTIAIESKFTETYRRHIRRELRASYVQTQGLWEGLPGCGKLAKLIYEEMGRKTRFTYLDVPQLLKHILGLSSEFGPKGFKLIYLWYEVPSKEAEKHRLEIEDFKEFVGDEVHFSDITYQELFESINRSPLADRNYVTYLSERYFPR